MYEAHFTVVSIILFCTAACVWNYICSHVTNSKGTTCYRTNGYWVSEYDVKEYYN